ncbi:MAG TPA: hypothetical protein VMV86_02760 [Methanosarcinales archaeon]|nr:hypothetical protein [Methanosarcinales archaeon]
MNQAQHKNVYNQYCTFCRSKKETPISKESFYESLYYLTINTMMSWLNNNTEDIHCVDIKNVSMLFVVDVPEKVMKIEWALKKTIEEEKNKYEQSIKTVNPVKDFL